MLAVVESAIGGVLPAVLNRHREVIASAGRCFPGPWWADSQLRSEVEHERPPTAAEMAHVHALRAPDPQAWRQRRVHVPEQRELGLVLPDRGKRVLAAPLEPAGDDVVGQFRD